MTTVKRLLRLIEGDWVKDAKDSGWWDDLKMLKGYLADMEFDYDVVAKGMVWEEELKSDIEIVRKRVHELEPNIPKE